MSKYQLVIASGIFVEIPVKMCQSTDIEKVSSPRFVFVTKFPSLLFVVSQQIMVQKHRENINSIMPHM